MPSCRAAASTPPNPGYGAYGGQTVEQANCTDSLSAEPVLRLVPVALLLLASAGSASAQMFLKLSGQRCFLFGDNGRSIGTELLRNSSCRVQELDDGVIRIGTRDGNYAFTPVEITANSAYYRINDGGALWQRVDHRQIPDPDGHRFEALEPAGSGYLSAITWQAPPPPSESMESTR